MGHETFLATTWDVRKIVRMTHILGSMIFAPSFKSNVNWLSWCRCWLELCQCPFFKMNNGRGFNSLLHTSHFLLLSHSICSSSTLRKPIVRTIVSIHLGRFPISFVFYFICDLGLWFAWIGFLDFRIQMELMVLKSFGRFQYMIWVNWKKFYKKRSEIIRWRIWLTNEWN